MVGDFIKSKEDPGLQVMDFSRIKEGLAFQIFIFI